MKEYIVYLTNPGESILILAFSFEEAHEIALERFGKDRLVNIILCETISDDRGTIW